MWCTCQNCHQQFYMSGTISQDLGETAEKAHLQNYHRHERHRYRKRDTTHYAHIHCRTCHRLSVCRIGRSVCVSSFPDVVVVVVVVVLPLVIIIAFVGVVFDGRSIVVVVVDIVAVAVLSRAAVFGEIIVRVTVTVRVNVNVSLS